TLLSRLATILTAPATTEPYTLSLHDALPIYPSPADVGALPRRVEHRLEGVGGVGVVHGQREGLTLVDALEPTGDDGDGGEAAGRSEEHTSELQSRENLVCRLLLEKKKRTKRS